MVSSALFNAVTSALNARKNHVLLFAQVAMTEHQFIAFKKLFLNEFGERGLEKDLKPLLIDGQHGMVGSGREYITQERGCQNE